MVLAIQQSSIMLIFPWKQCYIFSFGGWVVLGTGCRNAFPVFSAFPVLIPPHASQRDHTRLPSCIPGTWNFFKVYWYKTILCLFILRHASIKKSRLCHYTQGGHLTHLRTTQPPGACSLKTVTPEHTTGIPAMANSCFISN